MEKVKNKMESYSTLPSVHLPVRSISLPTRIHPTSVKVEAALNHLKTWQGSSSCTTSLGAETIQIGLVGLEELYNCVGELIQSPQTQQALLNYDGRKIVEETLDQSVTFLDTCGVARDILVLMKEHLQSLQSVLRRKGGDTRIENEANAYINSRKKAKKEITKCLAELKSLQSKKSFTPSLDMDPHLQIVARVLHEASAITISIFRTIFLYISMPDMKTRSIGWLKISKVITTRLFSSEKGQKIDTLVGNVDIAVLSLQGQEKNSNVKAETQEIQKMLRGLDSSIEGLESGLDCLFRCLVKHRVKFLDIVIC